MRPRRPLSLEEQATALDMLRAGQSVVAVSKVLGRKNQLYALARRNGFCQKKPYTAPAVCEEILKRLQAGLAPSVIAAQLGVGFATVARIAEDAGITPQEKKRGRKSRPVDPRVAREKRLKKRREEHQAFLRQMGISPPAKEDAHRPRPSVHLIISHRNPNDAERAARARARYLVEHRNRYAGALQALAGGEPVAVDEASP